MVESGTQTEDWVAQVISASARLISVLDTITPESQLFVAGLRILEAAATQIEPSAVPATVTLLAGGKQVKE